MFLEEVAGVGHGRVVLSCGSGHALLEDGFEESCHVLIVGKRRDEGSVELLETGPGRGDSREKLVEGRLPGATLYCSLEPCFMCAGALLHARVGRVVFGAADPKFGACGSLANLPLDERLNHRCPVVAGVLGEESAQMLREFFQALR